MSSPRGRLVLLAAVAALVMFSRSGDGLLANYDDCYYAEKAKEMLHGGDWLTPHFAGTIRLDNPPLFLWLVAAGFKLFGIGKYGAVFFSALAGVGSVMLLTRVARRLGLDEFESWSAGMILLTTQYFLKYAGHAMMDVLLTLLFLWALDGYLSGAQGKRRGWLQLGVATGLSVLTKSVLGLFPLVLAVCHRISVRRLKAFADPGMWVAGLSAVAVFAPWFIYQFAAHRETLVGEHFQWLIWNRGFTDAARAGIRNSPVGYLYGIAKLYWPWLPLALAGLWLAVQRAFARSVDPERRSAARLLLLWLVVVLGTMSLAHVKKLWYVMSVFPCLALLAAVAAGHFVRGDSARRRALSFATGFLIAFAAVISLTPIGAGRVRQADVYELAKIVRASVPAGEKVVNLDAPYWDIANFFVFYSDHDLTEPIQDLERVREKLRGGSWALIADRRAAEVVGTEPAALRIVARSGDWALVSGAPAAPVVLVP